MKEFNTTGVCVPEKHYMVNISDKLEEVMKLIDRGKYFTINRGRQYGKTTMLSALERTLQERYVVVNTSFEGADEGNFDSRADFAGMFVRLVAEELAMEGRKVPDKIIEEWHELLDEVAEDRNPFDVLDRGITRLCKSLDRPVLVMIDEIDKNADNQIFLNFLGMLRNKYLRASVDKDATFYSVVLAGIYDIKNLKLKIRPDIEKKYNSPWNIAVDFKVDMSFSAEEIATMLEEYENDYHTGMDIKNISGKLRFYTGGYPYLVSWLCNWMDEDGDKIFTEETLKKAVNQMLMLKTPLFDDMFKKMCDHPELADLLENILISGKNPAFVPDLPEIDLGVTFGILKEKEGKTTVANIIFETRLYNYFLEMKSRKSDNFIHEKSQFVADDGHLDMPRILIKFQEIMNAEYRRGDEKFYERQGGLLFLCFLKLIINGTGSYFVEPETRGNGRMDIVVFYEREEFIIELKIWRGSQYRQKGLAQLGSYMDYRNVENGYLVSYNFNKNKEQLARNVEVVSEGGKIHSVFEVVI